MALGSGGRRHDRRRDRRCDRRRDRIIGERGLGGDHPSKLDVSRGAGVVVRGEFQNFARGVVHPRHAVDHASQATSSSAADNPRRRRGA